MERAKAERLVEELFASWGPFLARYVVQMTRSPEAADDIIQETFLALYRDLREGKAIRNPRSWTFGAVRNQIRKRMHILVRHSEDLAPIEVLDQFAAEPHWPDVAAESLGESDLTLSVLTEREREVVLLRLQSFKYREIARQLGNSEKSVATLLARALHKLRKVGRGEGDARVAEKHVR
jgi:RNA polymerase sigma-70 factor (ECF subfamily)